MPLNKRELKRLNDAEPFHPFEIVLDDGRKVRIKERFHDGWTVERQSLMFDDNGLAGWVDFSRLTAVQRVRQKRRPSRARGKGRAN
jgi:hypothetical protein